MDQLENPSKTPKQNHSDTISDLFASESDHMPSRSYFSKCQKNSDLCSSFRQEAISLVLQAQFSCNLEPLCGYLAVNYIDRFMSRQEIPREKPWIQRLLVISCLSLAAKMNNTHSPLSNFPGSEENFFFDNQSIYKMELMVLDALNWRMRSITPFSFLPYFISLFDLKDPPLTQALKDRASEIIFKAHYEIKFLELKPSIIAAAALLVASHELFPLQFPSFNASISSSEFVDSEKLEKTLKTMEEMVEMEWYETTLDSVSSTKTPLSVLERHCSKSECSSSTKSADNEQIKRPKTSSSYTTRKSSP